MTRGGGGGVLLPIMANNILFYSILLNDPGGTPYNGQ